MLSNDGFRLDGHLRDAPVKDICEHYDRKTNRSVVLTLFEKCEPFDENTSQ